MEVIIPAALKQLVRRAAWLFDNARPTSMLNLASSAVRFAGGTRKASPLPANVKIDISPVCSLACPACLHANPAGRGLELLDRQSFDKSQRITLDQFSALIEEIKGHTLAVSLYYFGDSLAHPQFAQMARVAADAGLSVHASTHLSYNLSDEKIADIVGSGLTHLSIDVDGESQETYGVTRVRGKLDKVLNNLERLAQERRRQGTDTPRLEVQHLSFPHHAPGEARRVEEIVRRLGADDFTTFPGAYENVDGKLYNAVDTQAVADRPWPPRGRSALPRCHWPWSGTVIKYNGEVIPCCTWREGQQYAVGGESRSLGNVFEESLADIWNGDNYRQVRELVRNPKAHRDGQSVGDSFCDGCPKLFESAKPLGEWERG